MVLDTSTEYSTSLENLVDCHLLALPWSPSLHSYGPFGLQMVFIIYDLSTLLFAISKFEMDPKPAWTISELTCAQASAEFYCVDSPKQLISVMLETSVCLNFERIFFFFIIIWLYSDNFFKFFFLDNFFSKVWHLYHKAWLIYTCRREDTLFLLPLSDHTEFPPWLTVKRSQKN